jgi:hypothetical protein
VDTPAQHPAGNGLCDSGYVVSIVQPTTQIVSYVNDCEMICVTLPGKPCDVLLALSTTGMEQLVEHLDLRVKELRGRHQWGER